MWLGTVYAIQIVCYIHLETQCLACCNGTGLKGIFQQIHLKETFYVV